MGGDAVAPARRQHPPRGSPDRHLHLLPRIPGLAAPLGRQHGRSPPVRIPDRRRVRRRRCPCLSWPSVSLRMPPRQLHASRPAPTLASVEAPSVDGGQARAHRTAHRYTDGWHVRASISRPCIGLADADGPASTQSRNAVTGSALPSPCQAAWHHPPSTASSAPRTWLSPAAAPARPRQRPEGRRPDTGHQPLLLATGGLRRAPGGPHRRASVTLARRRVVEQGAVDELFDRCLVVGVDLATG